MEITTEIIGHYDKSLITLSLLIAIIASYTALDLAKQVKLESGKRKSPIWLLGGAIAMGAGIWSMHFVAMLAFHLPIPIRYNLTVTLLSLASAIAASTLALWLLSQSKTNRLWMIAGSICMGIAIALMHYIGMAALELEAQIQYNLSIVILSILIAILASAAALGLAFRSQNTDSNKQVWEQIGGAIIMGIAISGMHYSGMGATHFYQKEISTANSSLVFNQFWLAVGVGAITLMILIFTLASSFFDRRLTAQQIRAKTLAESEQRFQTLIREMQVGVLLLNNRAEILISNQSAQTLLKLTSTAEKRRVFGEDGHLLQEDGTPYSLEKLPVQSAITQRKPVRNIIVGIPNSESADRCQWLLVNATPQLMESGNVERVVCTVSEITRQKQTEAALRASEERFALAVEGGNDGIWDWEIQTGKTYISSRWKTMLGYFDDELPNRIESFRKVLHPEDSERVFSILERYLRREIPGYEVEFRALTKDGNIRWILSRGIAQWDGRNQPYRMVGYNTDITERKQVEQALQESAKREKSIVRVMQKMRETLELETIFSATTEELRQALCCSRVLVYRFQPDWSGEVIAESVTSGWTKLIPITEDRSYLKQITVNQPNCTVKLLESGDALIEDTYLKENQGGLFYSQGKSYYRSVRDIYAAGFDECYLNFLEQLQARSYVIAPIFCGTHLWGLLCAYQNGTPREWTKAEIKIVTQIGSQLGVAVQQAELFAKTQQQAKELREAKEAADAANRAKSEFLASMSHELRTPLNAILGFAQLMNHDSSINAEHRQNLEIITRAGEHLLNLINDILEMSKIEAGRVTLTENDFDLFGLLENLEKMFGLKAQSKKLRLKFERDDTLPRWVRGDEKKLRQVLINLIGNAIKFTQAGCVTLRVFGVKDVKIRPTEKNPTNNKRFLIGFEVSDTGPGIAEHELDRLFKAFSQTETGLKSSEGTGLGLSISQQFVQLMGGEISVQSQLNAGSTFSFEIPLSCIQPEKNHGNYTHKDVVRLAAEQSKFRILVAEDKLENRLLIVKILSEIGFEIKEVNNGQEAIELCLSWQPDLILMDMRMPVINGFEATRQINAMSLAKKPIIIALTASAFEEDRQAVLNAGCQDFVGKPFQRKELLEVIGKHLEVQYIYATDESQNINSSDQSSSSQQMEYLSSLEELETMPKDWIEQLYKAAQACSDLLIWELIDRIPPENQILADTLKELVDDFRYDRIMELTESKIAVQSS